MNQPLASGSARRNALAAIAVVMLIAAGWLLFGSSDSEAARNRLGYFYDIDARELVVAEDTGDDARAIRAMVFACGNCEDDTARFIGWLESAAADHDASQSRVIPSSSDSGYRIALPPQPGDDALQWSPRNEQTIAALRQAAMQQCSNTALTVCTP